MVADTAVCERLCTTQRQESRRSSRTIMTEVWRRLSPVRAAACARVIDTARQRRLYRLHRNSWIYAAVCASNDPARAHVLGAASPAPWARACKRNRTREPSARHVCREELFERDYAAVDWNAARNRCAREDLYYPHPWLQDAIWWVLYKAENLLLGSALRRAALREVMTLVHYEDENTRYIDIGPVNKTLNLVCCWFEDREGEPFKRCGACRLPRQRGSGFPCGHTARKLCHAAWRAVVCAGLCVTPQLLCC